MSRIVYTDPKGNAIVANMGWAVISGTGRAQIRERANRGIGAQRYVFYKPDGLNIGLETADVISLPDKKSKASTRHAFALLCRKHLLASEGDQLTGSNGIFVMSIGGEEDKRAICVFRDGSIIQDGVESAERAISIADENYREFGGYCTVFADVDDLPIKQVEDVQWEDLAQQIGKDTLLLKVPVSPMLPVSILGALLVAGCGFAYYQMIHLPRVQAERAKKLAEADKTPQYLKALREAAEGVGWERNALIAFIDSAKDRTYFSEGWVLSEMVCSAGKCIEKWSREGGMLSDLVKANPGWTLVADPKMNADTAYLEKAIEARTARLDLDNLPRGDLEKQLNYKPVIQSLDNAGVSMSVGAGRPWPNFDVRNVKKKEEIVRAEKVEVKTIYPFGTESIKELPANVIFNGFTLKAVNPKSFSLVVEGAGYVR